MTAERTVDGLFPENEKVNEHNQVTAPETVREPPVPLNIHNTGAMLFHGSTSSMSGICLLYLV